jgi:hypothetical protein
MAITRRHRLRLFKAHAFGGFRGSAASLIGGTPGLSRCRKLLRSTASGVSSVFSFRSSSIASSDAPEGGTVRRLVLISAAVLLLSAVLCAQLFGGKKTDDATAPRNLTGTIFDKDDHVVPSAIVYLKNTRSLSVATFITEQDGSYRFQNLSPNIDYEVRAESHGNKSQVKTLSSFDARKQAHINLKLDK